MNCFANIYYAFADLDGHTLFPFLLKIRDIRKQILLYLTFLPGLMFAQFPAPDSLQISINYIHLGESDWCDEKVIQGPNYCNFFQWQAPDTALTPATLTGYRIYKDDVLFLSTTQTGVDSVGGYMASFYVTAIYENPAGESDSSNVVTIVSLPVAAKEIPEKDPIEIVYDPMQQALIIRDREYARVLQVYNVQGNMVLFRTVVPEVQGLDGLMAGVYWVAVLDRDGRVYNKVICLIQ